MARKAQRAQDGESESDSDDEPRQAPLLESESGESNPLITPPPKSTSKRRARGGSQPAATRPEGNVSAQHTIARHGRNDAASSSSDAPQRPAKQTKRRRGEALVGHRRAESVLSGPLLRQAPLARLGMVAHAENDAFAAAVAISVGKPERKF